MIRRAARLCAPLLLVAGCSGSEATDAGIGADTGVGTDSGVAPADSGVDAGPQPCEAWQVEYALTGSEFEIRNTPFGAGDAVNVVGPGTLVLLFPGDEASGPTAGEVRMLQYTLAMEFEVPLGTAGNVATDVDITAGPEACGVAVGTRTSSVVAWSTPLTGYHSMGTVTCNASEFLCGAANLPVGQPVVQDTNTDQALMPFLFAGDADFSSFTMAEVEVPNDQAGDTFLRLKGAEVSRSCVAQPSCP